MSPITAPWKEQLWDTPNNFQPHLLSKPTKLNNNSDILVAILSNNSKDYNLLLANRLTINSLKELNEFVFSNRELITTKLWLPPDIRGFKLISKFIEHIYKKTWVIFFSKIIQDDIVNILNLKSPPTKTKNLETPTQRALIRLTNIIWKISEEYIKRLVNWVTKKSELIDFIDWIGSKKLIALFEACDVDKLVNYLNSNDINNFIIKLWNKDNEGIIKFAMKIWIWHKKEKKKIFPVFF